MAGKKALIVIDMQNDFLWDKRKAMFSYDTAALTAAVNGKIHQFEQAGDDVIYIAHVLPNLPTNRWFIGFSIRGTQGAELYKGVDIVSKLYFEKKLSNSFTARAFREYMQAQGYSQIHICGLDLCGCVGKTALGAAKVCGEVYLHESAVGCRFDSGRAEKMRKALAGAGVKFT